MEDKRPIIRCIVDACAPAPQIEIKDDKIIIPNCSEKFKHLAFYPIGNSFYMPLCSDDGENFVICYGAIRDGQKLDLIGMAQNCNDNWKEMLKTYPVYEAEEEQ